MLREAFAAPPAQRRTDLAHALDRAGRFLRRRAVICVLSDFLDDHPWDRPMSILARRHQVNCFLLHDPLDDRLPRVGLLEVEDAETGETAVVDARSVVPKVALHARLARLRRTGAWATAVRTDDDALTQLMGHFKRLERMR